jgi:hypothetical protein
MRIIAPGKRCTSTADGCWEPEPGRPGLALERVAQQHAIETGRRIARGRIAIQRRRIDAAQRGLHQADTDHGQYRQRNHADRRRTEPGLGQEYRQCEADEHHRDRCEAADEADAAVADQAFAPGALEQGRAFLHRLDRTYVLRDQHRHGEEGGERPRHADEAGDDPADDASALFDAAQEHADGRGDRRVAEDGHPLAGGDAQAGADRRIAAIEAHHRRADQRGGEEEHHEVLHQVEREAEDVEPGRQAVAAICLLEHAEAEQRQQECRRDQHHREHGQKREHQQFLVGTQDRQAGLGQRPTARELAHCGSPHGECGSWKDSVTARSPPAAAAHRGRGALPTTPRARRHAPDRRNAARRRPAA